MLRLSECYFLRIIHCSDSTADQHKQTESTPTIKYHSLDTLITIISIIIPIKTIDYNIREDIKYKYLDTSGGEEESD